MERVSSHIGKEQYKVEIKSPTGNIVIADEPVVKGGQDKGLSPKELLAASLAACTSATVRAYADRKNRELTEIKTEITLEYDDDANKTAISRRIEFLGNLDETQKARLLIVANACPVHKILSNPIIIDTKMI